MWAFVAWGVLIWIMSATLAESTRFWWLALLFGAAMPLLYAMNPNHILTLGDRRPAPSAKDREAELLGALSERGELTPTLAAMGTTLTVEEASAMLEELARKGHLKVRAQDGTLVYELPEQDRREPQHPVDQEEAALAPLEPLGQRELEVLGLVASGRSNREIARDLFVAEGTVKAHTANIYRKLEARNRAEAVSRARILQLL